MAEVSHFGAPRAAPSSEASVEPAGLVLEPLAGHATVEREERVRHVRRDEQVDVDSCGRGPRREHE